MTFSITLSTLSPPRGSCSGEPRFKSLLVWVLLCSLFWIISEVARAFFMKRIQPAVAVFDAQIEILKKEVADLEGRRERLLSSIGGPSVLEIRPSFPDSIDDDAVSFFLPFVFLLLLLHPVHLYVSYNTYLACVCHNLGL